MGTWNDEDTNRLFESGEKLLQSLTNEMNGYNYNTTGGTDMGKVRLTGAEAKVASKYIKSAHPETGGIQRAAVNFAIGAINQCTDERFTRIMDAILHGYTERQFKLKLWGVDTGDRYVYITSMGKIIVTSRFGAGYFTQSDLDNNYDLERLADGCVKEYED